ncbi:MAG: hypothetical protein UW30_C0001G0069 [Candidatus Giovannonibacteria bacterium GW2011_GWA2_44_13b]|uniref:Uncharacterized protein n=2 Tax=Candidatus Giovannoniibacteriota TaxID=1752738 RepID=A0A0G1K3F0_9BACT|nr:MAG: hypothetical protein UW30_C0001G0069 [Candidatus Giovannonibacteria bacterium GW2011_GWA2_44_13b]OGF83250.1 MAG: hypothetical protein A2924_02960 [Candidatus Giovannonibacteria bacterium RIFCSPLOWO2_01_FULL_44_16]
MTDLAKAQKVVGRVVSGIKIEGKDIWLDFQDGGRMVVYVKDRFNGGIHTEKLRVFVDNEIVHQFKLF